MFLCELTGRRVAAVLLLGAVFLAYPHLAFVPLDGSCCAGPEGEVRLVRVPWPPEREHVAVRGFARVIPAPQEGTRDGRCEAEEIARLRRAFPPLCGAHITVYLVEALVGNGDGMADGSANWGSWEMSLYAHRNSTAREVAEAWGLSQRTAAHEVGHLVDSQLLPKCPEYLLLRGWPYPYDAPYDKAPWALRPWELAADDFAFLFGSDRVKTTYLNSFIGGCATWGWNNLPSPGEPERVFWLAAAARAERWKEVTAGGR